MIWTEGKTTNFLHYPHLLRVLYRSFQKRQDVEQMVLE